MQGRVGRPGPGHGGGRRPLLFVFAKPATMAAARPSWESTGSVWSSVLMEPLDSRARTASRAATADLHQSALANLNAHGGDDGVLLLGVVRDVDDLIGHKLQMHSHPPLS